MAEKSAERSTAFFWNAKRKGCATKCTFTRHKVTRLSVPSRCPFRFASRDNYNFRSVLLSRRVYQRQLDPLNYVCDLIKFSPTAPIDISASVTLVNARGASSSVDFTPTCMWYLYGDRKITPRLTNLHNVSHVRSRPTWLHGSTELSTSLIFFSHSCTSCTSLVDFNRYIICYDRTRRSRLRLFSIVWNLRNISKFGESIDDILIRSV